MDRAQRLELGHARSVRPRRGLARLLQLEEQPTAAL
jgi:hypothetical protein